MDKFTAIMLVVAVSAVICERSGNFEKNIKTKGILYFKFTF